jgi:integrase/recombinase XerD
MASVYKKNCYYNNKVHSSNSWKSLPHAIEPDDIKKLLKRRYGPRDKCMIFILLRTGMRISELLNLKPQDIHLRERMILINHSAKTGVGRIAYLSDDAYKTLTNWLKIRISGKKFLFYSHSRENMSYGTARLIFIKYLKRAGLSKKGYTLHCLRHTFASELLSAGMSLESLQILMGHSNIEMTRRYARLTNNALKKDYFNSVEIIIKGEIDGSYRDHI